MLVKLKPGGNFINVLHTAFALVDPKSVKNTVKSSVSFYAFGIYERKSCTYNVDEIEPWWQTTILLPLIYFHYLPLLASLAWLDGREAANSKKIPSLRLQF